MFDIIYFMFACIGISIVIYYSIQIFFELMYIIIFTIGYIILHIINFNWQKVRKNKTGVWFDILTIIKQGFLTSLDSPTELILGKWNWIPLFNFKYRK